MKFLAVISTLIVNSKCDEIDADYLNDPIYFVGFDNIFIDLYISLVFLIGIPCSFS